MMARAGARTFTPEERAELLRRGREAHLQRTRRSNWDWRRGTDPDQLLPEGPPRAWFRLMRRGGDLGTAAVPLTLAQIADVRAQNALFELLRYFYHRPSDPAAVAEMGGDAS
jgi:hypothetical protein